MAKRSDTHNTISGGIFFSAVIQGRDITVQLPAEIPPHYQGFPLEQRRSSAAKPICAPCWISWPPAPPVTLRYRVLHRRPR